MIGKTIGNLKIVSELGKGGMGVVYLAEHMTLNKRFAVKSLAPELTRDPLFSERFYQEARNQALLAHPNIVQATDFFDEEDQYFLVMEYVYGKELGDLIQQEGKLTEEETFRIAKDILSGLGFAHSKGVIHRDVKPSNVLVGEDGRARIMDFGIAILAGDRRLTATGSNIGSPWYMSPEQIARPREVDNRSDIYSLGCVLFEMLTGELPFDGETDYDVKNQQIDSPTPDPAKINPDITGELSALIIKAMEKDPEKRFQSCEEFLARIEAYEMSRRGEKPRPALPKTVIWALAAIAIVSAALATIQMVRRDTGGQETELVLEAEREVAAALILNSLDQASFLCREVGELGLKKEAVQIARESLGDTALVERYERQIDGIKNNIDEGVFKLNEALAQLAAKQKEVVDQEFVNHLESLQSARPFEKAQTLRKVRKGYERYEKSGKKLDAESIGKFCVTE